MYLDGVLDIDSMISHRMDITGVNDGFDLMARGESSRTVVTFGD